MIHKSIVLHCSQQQAFQLFTDRVSDWWPKTHRLTKDPESELFLQESGRFWERSRDGQEMDLGRVVLWEPPCRLTLDFYLGTNAAQPTTVDVTFNSEGPATRVTVQHRPKPESADLWNARAPIFQRSWESVLGALANR